MSLKTEENNLCKLYVKKIACTSCVFTHIYLAYLFGQKCHHSTEFSHHHSQRNISARSGNSKIPCSTSSDTPDCSRAELQLVLRTI